MMSNCVLVLALAVFGASATYGGFGSYGGGLGGRVTDVCRCVKTVVRPHVRTEITAIPTVQSFVRTESTPVIERIPYAVSRRVDTPGFVSGGFGGVGGFSGVNGGGFGGVGVGLLSGVSGINNGYGY